MELGGSGAGGWGGGARTAQTDKDYYAALKSALKSTVLSKALKHTSKQRCFSNIYGGE